MRCGRRGREQRAERSEQFRSALRRVGILVANIRSFRDLLAYQRSVRLTRLIRDYSLKFPADERYILQNQIRRAANSVPLNIAEGYGLATTQATLRHLRIARGSLCEVQGAIDVAAALGYQAPPEELTSIMSEAARLLQGLIRSLEAKQV